MLGLNRHIVRVVDHKPVWAALGAEACRQVKQAGGDLIADVQHIGSTAVPDLPAKPILDLAAAVFTIESMPGLVKKLMPYGYLYRGDGGISGGRLFIRESEPNVRTIHLHVIALDDIQWTNYIRFRDLLRQDPVLRKQYAKLKQELGKKFPDDRNAYTDSKDAFIQGVLRSMEAQPKRTPSHHTAPTRIELR